MDNILKKRLALIKARARRLKETGSAEPDGSSILPSGQNDGGDGSTSVHTKGIEMYSDINSLPGVRLEDVVPGEERSIGNSRFFLIRLEDNGIDPDAGRVAARFRLDGNDPGANIRPAEDISRAGTDPLTGPREGVCFFDIETTGLSSSTYAFLCGLMFLEGDRFVVEQLFARDYDEEWAVMNYLRQRFAGFQAVVSYNGKTFDIPFIRARMAVNRLEFEENFKHVDLLQSARRVYTGFLENCKLGTVERYLRGEDREGDIPGGEIPEAYHNFVRTGNAEVMERVLYHNRMDLLTLAILYDRLWSGGADKNER
jgi:uncharacterized protein YprB with RNaseH-like and TPR domain